MTEELRKKMLEFPKGQLDTVLDTDAFNEIDDQFAISYMLLNPERFRMLALTAAPFFNENSVSPEDGMERSYDEIRKIVKLAGFGEEIGSNIYRGSRTYLKDEKIPVESEAANRIAALARAHDSDRPLYVFAIGAITNVASALLLDPSIADRMVVVWLGGHAYDWPNTKEFNMVQDIAAARVVFNSGVPLWQIPCMDVAEMCRTTAPELRYWLEGQGPLCDYLVQNTIEGAERYAAHDSAWSRVIWDVTAPAVLLSESFRTVRAVPAPLPEYDGTYSFPAGRHTIMCVTHLNRDAIFTDLFRKLRGGK